VSALEHPPDRPRDDRIGHPESRFDLHVVADDAAIRVVKQGAFVPPDAVSVEATRRSGAHRGG
jgi:hypothetical protein